MCELTHQSNLSIDAKIIGRGLNIDCVIRNISEDDVVICTPVPASVPGKVYLWERSTTAVFECDLQWQGDANLFGLGFSDASGRERRRSVIQRVLRICEAENMSRRRDDPERVDSEIAA